MDNEEVKPVSPPGTIQRNFNSIMLTIAVALMGYVAKTVTAIEVTTAVNVKEISTNADNIGKLQNGQVDLGVVLEHHGDRLTRLETIQEQTKK